MNTTLCYIRNENNEYLLLHRNKKENDLNEGKWIGVGGKFADGETAEECVCREVFEETGVQMEIDRLGFVHENYFYGDDPSKAGKLVYEISFYFYMKVPEDFSPVCVSFTEDGHEEFLQWIDPKAPVRYYPGFFRDEVAHPENGVRHFVTDERRQL
jgi:8-oxo-dGTP pyrophosphatase MutT (NUDIX family)